MAAFWEGFVSDYIQDLFNSPKESNSLIESINDDPQSFEGASFEKLEASSEEKETIVSYLNEFEAISEKEEPLKVVEILDEEQVA